MEHRHTHTRAELDAKERLKNAGLRITASRIAVLDLLQHSTEPMTHQEVVEILGDSPWNRSTLYRNLVDLTDAGLVRKTVIAGLMRFEPSGRNNGCGDHAHFVCSDCGEVTHLEGVTVRLEGGERPRAVTAGKIEVQLRGRCDRCDDATVV